MKNQINKQAASFLEPVTRETRDAAREIQSTSTHSAKVMLLLYLHIELMLISVIFLILISPEL